MALAEKVTRFCFTGSIYIDQYDWFFTGQFFAINFHSERGRCRDVLFDGESLLILRPGGDTGKRVFVLKVVYLCGCYVCSSATCQEAGQRLPVGS
jgi:hypothetical protein